MKVKQLVRGFIVAVGICSIFAIQVHAASSTAYLYENDNFVNTATVRTVGPADSDRYVTFNGEVYSNSKKPASFGVYFLNSKGNWQLSYNLCKLNQQPGDSFGSTSSYGDGNFAYLRIVAGSDMNGWLNKNAIAKGTVNGQ